MDYLFLVIVVFSGISALFYILMTSAFFFGWSKIKEFKPLNTKPNTHVSVIVAARNEESNILSCLQDLCLQDYPLHLFEIIIVDDNSEDATFIKCKNFVEQKDIKNVHLISLSEFNLKSKKEAVNLAVEKAKGELIATTDADCRMGRAWLRSIVSFYRSNSAKMICGPVTYEKKKSFFHQFQILDFLSMIISGAGAIYLNKSFIGNAANMAFERKVFLEVASSKYDNKYTSGDDVFLMHKIKEIYPQSIAFIKSKEAIIKTKPQGNMGSLIMQRLRWASKSKAYRDKDAVLFSLTVFVFSFFIVFSLLMGMVNVKFIFLALILFLIKLLFDFPLILSIAKFMDRKELLKHYIWIQLIYPLYIVFVASMALFKKNFSWKGRTY